MRIIQLTPGTGSFYCGTCVRDNALVKALRRLGHDALMAPMYLPPTLDEAPATTDAPLLFGGVNVYLQQKSSLFRKTPRWLDRVFDAPGLLKAAGARAGMTRASELGEITLSMLRGEEGNQLKELDRLVEWLEIDGKPEVVCLSNILLLGLAREIRRRTGAAVVCTLQGEDGYLDSLPEADARAAWKLLSERAKDVDAFVAISRYYGELMTHRAGLPADRVHVAHCGIDLEGYETTEERAGPPVLGYMARLAPVKGLDTLVEAFIRIRKSGRLPNLKLKAAGTQTASDVPFLDRMRARLREEGLESEAEFFPNVDRDQKLRFLKSLSALSVPTVYGESFGLYTLESMAAGTPVVQPRHAAFPEIVEATGGGVLYEPGDDPAALAAAVTGLLSDPGRAREIGSRGRDAVFADFSAEAMARRTAEIFERAVERRAAVPS